MKRILLAAAAALAVISCGNKGGVEIAPARQETNAGVIKVTGKPVEASLKSGVKIQIQKALPLPVTQRAHDILLSVIELVRHIGHTGSAVCAHHAQQIEIDLDLRIIGAFHIFVYK